MIVNGKKKCGKCKRWRGIKFFASSSQGDGLQGYCAVCRKDYYSLQRRAEKGTIQFCKAILEYFEQNHVEAYKLVEEQYYKSLEKK